MSRSRLKVRTSVAYWLHPVDIRTMPWQTSCYRKTFHFNFDARTSRGPIRQKDSVFLKLQSTSDPGLMGLGEAGPLAGLSPESLDQVWAELSAITPAMLGHWNPKDDPDAARLRSTWGLQLSSSSVFALETAALDVSGGGRRQLYQTPFLTGAPVPINGLIWMGGMDYMLQQVAIKFEQGFRCIKMKVGGMDFEKECDILQYIRRKYYRDDITIRLDANGGFKPDDALHKLQTLARWNIHSIEQPIAAGQPALLKELCEKSPIPIALDEELIGKDPAGAGEWLADIRPQYLILKPTLHGGLEASRRWIALADRLGIGWWITSALESNVGLNAIAQFVSQYDVKMPQGLGTGTLYDDNFESPLVVEKGQLRLDHRQPWTDDFFGERPAED